MRSNSYVCQSTTLMSCRSTVVESVFNIGNEGIRNSGLITIGGGVISGKRQNG